MIMSELIKGQEYWPGLDQMSTSGIGVAVSILTKPNIWNGVTVKEGRNDALLPAPPWEKRKKFAGQPSIYVIYEG